MLLEVLVWGMLGLLFGSFTNVLVLRWGYESFVSGRSHCPQCARDLTWYELLPVLSYLFLLGKCRTCHMPISIQYPIVEIVMAALFIVVGLSDYSLLVRAIGALMSILLVAITVYDFRHTLIPDAWSFSFAFLALIYGLLVYAPTSVYEIALFVLSGPLLALPLAGLWLFSGGTWMGLGDAKLVVGFPWVLGLFSGYLALSMAFVMGAIVGVSILLPLPYLIASINKLGITRYAAGVQGFTMKSEVPFGPFLIAAFFIVWISDLYNYQLWAHLEPFLLLSSWW